MSTPYEHQAKLHPKYDAEAAQVVAHLAASPKDIEAKIGIPFASETDDLGPYKVAHLTVLGEPYVLMAYDLTPMAGTSVYGKPDTWNDDKMHALGIATSWTQETDYRQ